ncbi:MAG TPA: multidrug efflux SMR transporter [Polyangia bacterium]|nr:multidrug efflux SMR transporter [Polyangia bacterium]
MRIESVFLLLAIFFEASWALGMKWSRGFSRLGPSVLTVILYGLSLLFLTLATRRGDVGTTYAVWAGCGAALIAIAGVLLFKEPFSLLRALSLLLIIAGVVGVNLAEGGN